MTEERFLELVDLYLDGEISPEQLTELKADLSNQPVRQKRFTELRRLHEATRAVLASEGSGLSASASRRVARRKSAGRRRSRSANSRSKDPSRRSGASVPARSTRSRSRSGGSSLGYAEEGAYRVGLPRWITFSGLAASLCLSFVLLRPVYLDTVDAAALPELVGVRQSDLISPGDPAEAVRRSDFERYKKRQEVDRQQHASLVAQMRLLGLRPEHTPMDKQLQSIDASRIAPKGDRISQSEFLARLQTIRPMPDPELLSTAKIQPAGGSIGPFGGFEARLVGY